MFKMIGPESGSKDLDLVPTKNLKIPSFDSMSSNVTFLIYINQMRVLEWFWKIVQNTFKFLGVADRNIFVYCFDENMGAINIHRSEFSCNLNLNVV